MKFWIVFLALLGAAGAAPSPSGRVVIDIPAEGSLFPSDMEPLRLEWREEAGGAAMEGIRARVELYRAGRAFRESR